MAGELSERLLAKLRPRFSGRGLQVHEGTQPVASFPAAHPGVGDVRICDDGDELTLYVGPNGYHSHFSTWNYPGTVAEQQERVVGDVVAFLEELLADRIVLWTDGRVGGAHDRGQHNTLGRREVRRYVWSGPLPGEET